MTCPSNKPSFHRCQAYTFLEIALSLAIIAVVFAAVMPLLSAGYQERRLRGGLDGITQLISDLRLEAEKTGVGQLIVLEPRVLALRDGTQLIPKVPMPKGVTLSVRYPQGKWQVADNQEWRIFPGGLVAPASLRLQDGETWIEADFDFLTGNVVEERYSF